MEALSESEGSVGGHWKSRLKKQRSSIEDDDLSQPWSVDKMMRITTSFLRGEVADGNQERKKSLPPWKQQEAGHKQNFKKEDLKISKDFKDLNKACPKDGYPLPEINWKVESLCGFSSGCIQGNAGVTYQRLVDKEFHKQIGRNLEVYVDDLVIKSRTEDEIIRDIEETFKTLREINMKLNPKKCTFGVEEGMFLGRTKVEWKAGKLEQPRLKRPGSELHINGKIGFSAGTRQQASENIHPSTPNYSGHRSAHKATDFIVECREEDDPDTAMEVEEELSEPWILFTDGSSCADGSEAGLILTNPEGAEFTYALRIAEEMGAKNLQENVDSRLVANQVNGTYIANEADMIQYLEKVRTLTNGFRMFSIKQVLKSENKKADALSKKASTSFPHLSKQVLFEELKDKSINELEVLAVVEEEGNTWMTLIYEYLTEETLLAEVNKARAVRRNSQ
ncbi:reverse transcriptase domain-containing protein [Tanacetum coccineum]